jgi:GTP-binding protein
MPTKRSIKKQSSKEKPQVVIFGRANTGKSTLFNTLRESRMAMVSPQEGVTRDSNAGDVSWRGVTFELIDTGGIIDSLHLGEKRKKEKQDTIEKKVQQQALNYLEGADVIIFLVDSKIGILPQDEHMASFLKKRYSKKDDKKIITVANKVDKGKKEGSDAAVFHKLNLGEPVPISAATGSGTGDLLDVIVDSINDMGASGEEGGDEEGGDATSVCIIGRPNVGKSSLLNSLLQYEKAIVSDIPHTTREPQNVEVTYGGQTLVFVDTAGINKKARKAKGLEKYGIERSLQALARADIALLVLDVTQEITQQERKLIDEIMARRKSFILVANKWDLVKNRETAKFAEYIYDKLPFATWAPINFTSASTGKNVTKIYDTILEVEEQRKTRLSDSQLERFLKKIIKRHSPTKAKGFRRPYIYEIKQTKEDPPKFDVRIGSKDTLNESYVRFIENQLRDVFGFKGTPINIEVVK